MLKRSLSAIVAVMMGMVVVGLGLADAGPARYDDPSIKDVMKKLNGKGANTESAKLKKALNAKPVDWDTVQASTKVYAELGAALPKNKPAKGDEASWKTFSEGYASQTEALNAAAEKKDLAATKGAFGKISMGCMACHQAHRGR